jgi:DNA polymerase III delta prime subunit
MLLVLGLQERPDLVANSWRLTVQESNLPPRHLPESTRITDIYDDTGGEFLLLGEPGAGKTTLLLDLARALLNRAEQNERYPMPVVFNLSSWAQRRLPFAAWLVEELHNKYQIPFVLGHTWIATDQILLLLDGLDEVNPAHRSACVEAINRYREEHGLVPLVVCSRSSDYLSQPVRLLVRTAVTIQPLSLQQIRDYIEATGGSLIALQHALDHDPILQEMASTPLMLNILVLTYHQMPHEELLTSGSLVQRRHTVLKHYVERVLQRRGPQKAYTPEQTIRHLAWLAHQMVQHSQTEFYLERIQPDWLSSPHQYRRILLRLIYGIESMVIAALYAWLRGGKQGNEVSVSV